MTSAALSKRLKTTSTWISRVNTNRNIGGSKRKKNGMLLGKKMDEEYRDERYERLMKYIGGEPHDIMPGTLESRVAEIAAKLVSDDPALMLPANREKLEAEMREIYKREERAWLAEAGLF